MAVKKAPKAVSGTSLFKTSEEKNQQIPFRQVLSFMKNPRESVPTLNGLGYGIFAQLEGADKPAIVALALSDKPEDKAEYIKLIDKFEVKIAELASDIVRNRLISPVRVRPRTDGDGYDLVVGCRRFLAFLYNYCRTNIDSGIPAIVTDIKEEDVPYMALAENMHRMDMSPIDQAKWFQQLRNMGLKTQQIADETKFDKQVVNQRLDLLKLSEELQARVHEGDLGVVKALKIVRGKADPKNPSAVGKGSSGDGTRRRAPTYTEFTKFYNERADLNEKVREWIALEILKVPYMPFKELQALKVEQDKKEAAAKEKEKSDKEAKKDKK